MDEIDDLVRKIRTGLHEFKQSPWGTSRYIERLGELQHPEAVEELAIQIRHHSLQARQALEKQGDYAIQILLELLNDARKPLRLRRRVIRALGALQAEEAVVPLIALLDMPPLREEVIVVLGQIGDARVVEPVVPYLSTDRETLNLEAAITLGLCGDRRGIRPLLKAVRLASGDVYDRMLVALKRIISPADVDLLLEIFCNESNLFQRIKIGRVLAGSGEARVIPFLLDTIYNDLHAYPGRKLVESMIHIPHPYIDAMLEKLMTMPDWSRALHDIINQRRELYPGYSYL